MIGHIFYWIINMSLASSLIALPVFLIRCAKVLPKRFFVFLWIPPFLHLILPFGIASGFSFLSAFSHLFSRTIVKEYSPEFIELTSTNVLSEAEAYNPLTFPNDTMDRFFQTCGIVWLVVAILIFLLITILYHVSFWKIGKADHLYGNLYESDQVRSPMVFGIVAPKIVFPKGFSKTGREYVIDHEKMHIKWADNLWRLLALYIMAVHWFNPVCWIMFYLMISDLEFACDERVISSYSWKKRGEYARTLLNGVRIKHSYFSPFFGGGVKKRILCILNYKELTRIGACGSLVFLLMMITFLVGYAK